MVAAFDCELSPNELENLLFQPSGFSVETTVIYSDPHNEGGGRIGLFCSNDPINFFDPNGRGPIGAIIGGVFGAITGYAGAAATGGDTTDRIVGAIIGGLGGAVVGAIDITEGALTIQIIQAAALGGTVAAVGDLVGQDVTQIRKMRDNPCYNGQIDYGEVTGAAIGGAIGGAIGQGIASELKGATTEVPALLFQNVVGGVPAFVGPIVGNTDSVLYNN